MKRHNRARLRHGGQQSQESSKATLDRQATTALDLAKTCLSQALFLEALEHCGLAVKSRNGRLKAAAYTIMGRVLMELERHDEALVAVRVAMDAEQDNPDAYFVLGLIQEARHKPLDAFQAYQAALTHRPTDVLAYNNLAGLLIGLEQFDLAIAAARAAVLLAPDQPDIYLNLAMALRLRGHDEEALQVYKTIVTLKPDHGEGLVELCHRKQHFCDWDGLREQRADSLTHSYRKGRLVSPFSIMTSTGSPVEQLLCARVWGERLRQPHEIHRPKGDRPRRLRVGYLSADFHNHATAMLVVDLMEHHDRGRFEIFGYSMGLDDGSALRRRINKAVDHFTDLRGVSDADAARLIRADEIDILLDLKGYTQNARVKILAHQPAPIQVNYLGYPGTMGAPFIQYLIADAQVAPLSDQAFFDERIVHLPHCYQPNDRLRWKPATRPERLSLGLPREGFVFCSFNGVYKITPEIFGVWMRLLAGCPGSVLWLLETNPVATSNLRTEAQRRGIDPERLIFAPFVPVERHLERLLAADLFLDTCPVNAHTTASEALWVGLPLLTLSGESFASRVAASLLHAIGLPELVTRTLAAYEAKAHDLAHDVDTLKGLRDRLETNRLVSPLFDTPRYTRAFEAALTTMVERFDAGLSPEPFSVADEP